MTTKRIVDIRMSTVNGKMLKTTFYSDGSKMTAIVPGKATDRLIKSLDGTPDLRVMTGYKDKKQSGEVGYVLLVALVILTAVFSGCIDDDDRCRRPGWHRYDDCFGEP